METDYKNRIVNVSDYKISLTKLLEENRRKMHEHHRELQNQREKAENKKQELNSFVCDWQTI